MAHNVQMPPDLNISTQREGGEGKGLIYKAAGAVVLQINFPDHLNFKDLRVILGIYVIESNEVLFNVCIASSFQILGARESSYAHLLLRLEFS